MYDAISTSASAVWRWMTTRISTAGTERGEVEHPADRLLESAFGLDDVVVQDGSAP